MRCFPVSVAAFALCLSFASARSAEHFVRPDGSGDFATIQSAIDAAVDGDVVLLGDGIFGGTGNSNIFFYGKAITVQSLNQDAHNCIIDCRGDERGVNFVYSEDHDSQLKWVTIRNGSSPSGAAAAVTSASPTFHGVIFENNIAEETGGAIAT